MGRDAGQHASVLNTFDKIVHLVVLALPEQPVGDPAMMDNGDRLRGFDDLFDGNILRAAGVQADEFHLRTPLSELLKDAAHFFRVAELVDIDACLFARPKEFDDSLRREILLHVPVHDGAHVGVSADGIRADDEACNVVLAETYRGQQRRG